MTNRRLAQPPRLLPRQATAPARQSRRRFGAQRLASRGLSLVELLCVLALSTVLLGGAVPMFQDLRAGAMLQATAALLETDLQFARSTAITQGSPVRLSVLATADGGSCYVLYTGAAQACDCDDQGPARCEAGASALRLVQQAARSGVRLAPLARSILFDAQKGTVTPTATIQVLAADGRAIHQVVNIMGRVRSCAPAGSVGGLPACR